MSLETFHPAVGAWFRAALGTPTEPQARAWPAIQGGRHTLVAAPTGSGKTLAAFLSAIDGLVRAGLEGALADETRVLYISPLKALSNDIEKNLSEPLAGIARELEHMGLPAVSIRTAVRTGDTPSARRTAIGHRPPHIFVTTPESLYIMLTSDGGRRLLAGVRTVIVDEIHALSPNKRGSHLSLSLERLQALAGHPVQRIGLSATQKPIEEVARFLVGAGAVGADGTPNCAIIDGGHVRDVDLAIEVPASPIETVMSGEVWEEIYDRLAALIQEHRTTLVFVNTRRLAERLARHLSERIGEADVTAHHGSLAREHRLRAEQALKAGKLRALVATASLELGIDIGDVDLVCQIGSTRSIAALLQRVGRSGHSLGRVPRGRIFPLTRDELVEAVALIASVRRGELDALSIPPAPLDILAQQIVAALGPEEWTVDALYALVRRAWPYRDLSRGEFDKVVRMLGDGFATARGRRRAYLHHDAVNGKLRGRRGARLAAITSGGAIPDNADYDVVLEPAGLRVGSLNEDFAIESMAGDIFQLGNASYRILRVEQGKVRVEDARGEPPSIPFWFGEAPARSAELSQSVSRLRQEVVAALATEQSRMALPVGVGEGAARQVLDYLEAVQRTLGVMPTQTNLVLERFFDETGGMHVVLHAPFGSRINRAWGLALRKRFCRKFNFELQAAANEDAIVLSLGPTHSFPLEEIWDYLKSGTVRDVLVQALLDAPMFGLRWRWNATRALSVLRFRGGRKVPPPFQRMDSDDLLSLCFPDQAACLENVVGDREIPDHPLVTQTIEDCLHEAMDIDGLTAILRDIEERRVRLFARDLTEPSPLASEILNARPYAFLDDAPLEERRTQAVRSRRWLDPKTASDLGALDPAAIERVRDEARPEPRDAEELHEALCLFGWLTDAEANRWRPFLEALVAEGRAARMALGSVCLWVAAERADQLRAVHAGAGLSPEVRTPESLRRAWSRDDALTELLRGRLEATGPVTAGALAADLGVEASDVGIALAALEVEGFILRGSFSAGTDGTSTEWCERRLLARIHRYTLNRLRAEIEPVHAADFMRFLIRWQHADPESQLEGQAGVAAIVDQLQGYEVAAAAWETDVLPQRCVDYDPAWLDALCLSGRIAWARRTPSSAESPRGPVRTTPIALMGRSTLAAWRAVAPLREDEALSEGARLVVGHLRDRGASFFEDLVAGTGLARPSLEDALGELASCGLVSSDGFAGLRALIAPASRRRAAGSTRQSAVCSMESAGRWSGCAALTRDPSADDEAVAIFARQLLSRWGVVFRRLLDREGPLPPWRDLLRVYRRLEARGEIRGGRFVAGFSGEQYALPEAVGLLRKLRRERTPGKRLVSVSAADPLNLVGIVTPGPRVASVASTRIAYLDGAPIAVSERGEVRRFDDASPAPVDVEAVLARRRVPAPVRAYLSR